MALRSELFLNLLASTPDAVLIVEPGGTIVVANAAVEKVFGYDSGELTGHPVDILVPEALRSRHSHQRDGFRNGGGARPMGSGLSIQGVRKDGGTVPLDIQLTALHHEGVQYVAAVARDISHLVALQKQLAEQAEELQLSLQESESRRIHAEALSEEKTRLLGVAAHDLRSPLTALGVFAELLESGALASIPDELKPLVHNISRNVDYMAKLIEEMLDFSAVEDGRMHLRPSRTDVAELVESALAAEQARATPRGVTVVTRMQGVGIEVIDGGKLEQIVHNLVGNAIRYAPRGTDVVLELRRTPVGLTLSVRDHGPGVSPEIRDQLFQPFVHADTADHRGTGLGLAIVRRIAEGHGGSIRLEEPASGGSLFVVELPLAVDADVAAAN